MKKQTTLAPKSQNLITGDKKTPQKGDSGKKKHNFTAGPGPKKQE